jgi:hypothetical protein
VAQLDRRAALAVTALAPLPGTTRRRNLIVVRAGDESLHGPWLEPRERSYDVLVSYFGAVPGTHASRADAYEQRPGPKWPCIAAIFAAAPELARAYDAYWFPDDDLAMPAEAVERMFALFHGLALELAQPALTADSYWTWDFLRRRRRSLLRYTRFVEVMCPLFSRAMLARCLDTFAENRSGWGIDWIWPERLPAPARRDAMAILDATPIRHTRPLGGALYRNHAGLDPRAEERDALERHGLVERRMLGKYTAVTACLEPRALPWYERLALRLRWLNAWRRWRRRRRARP